MAFTLTVGGRAKANITPLLIKDPIRVITFHQDLMRVRSLARGKLDIARESKRPDAALPLRVRERGAASVALSSSINGVGIKVSDVIGGKKFT